MRRANEEIAALRRKLERAKKLEQHSADEVLVEEVRELREQLTCPSCQVKIKIGNIENFFTRCIG
jgi:E3 ubiquitin-protein ligase BRE1